MNNHIDFTVNCRKRATHQEVIRVYYIHHNGKPFPLPPNICDNSDNSNTCQRCIADILSQALTMQPPFFR